MSRRTLVVWSLVALAGLVVAAGVSLGVRALTTEDVGLSSEPITAGEELAPPAARRADDPAAVAPAPSTPAPVSPPVVDDDGGDDDGGKGRGRGRSDGDSGSDDSGGSGSEDSGDDD